MQLTPEQLEQCRAEFMMKFKLVISDELDRAKWIGYQAAWRPIPSVEEITKVLTDNGVPMAQFIAVAIRRAFGGEDE